MTTLLIGSPNFTGREWVKSHRKDRDLLVVDPAEPNYGTPARVALIRGEKSIRWRFVGSLDPTRNPLAVLSGVASISSELQPDWIALLPAYRHSPVLRHLCLAIAQLLRPDEILVPDGSDFEGVGWTVGPQRVVLEAAFHGLVRSAQRRARWIELIEQAVPHEVPLDRVSIEGLRLGSGIEIPVASLQRTTLDRVLYAESFGQTSLLIADHELSPDEMATALDLTHAVTATVVEPQSYSGLLCSFADQEGVDFGMGILDSIDFTRRVIHTRCTAIPPAPVRILRVGSLRIDDSGKELGETKPWAA